MGKLFKTVKCPVCKGINPFRSSKTISITHWETGLIVQFEHKEGQTCKACNGIGVVSKPREIPAKSTASRTNGKTAFAPSATKTPVIKKTASKLAG